MGLSVFFTLVILCASVFLPMALSQYQDGKMLEMVQIEELKESSEFQIADIDIIDKLSMISSAERVDANMIKAETSSDLEEEKIIRLMEECLAELNQKEMIPELEYDSISVNETVKRIYTEIDTQKSVSCYSIAVNIVKNSSYTSLYMIIDAQNGKVYGVDIIPDDEPTMWIASNNKPQAWADYFGVTFVETTSNRDEDVEAYKIADTDIYCQFSYYNDNGNFNVEIFDGLSIGYAIADR